jgi:hypothetical protein
VSGSGSGFNWDSGFGSGTRQAKMIKKKTKKDEISYFEVLNVLFGGLEVGCPRNKQKNFSFKNKYIAIFY